MRRMFRSKSFILMLIFLLVTVSCFAASTLARYVGTFDVPFEDQPAIDFSVHSVFVVKNQIELFAAINQGYSYIQISNDLKNPFVITDSPKNLTTDLILDLNGIELYRHGTDPVFVIKDGVRLTITDTSETQRGCLYNPTGSVIKISGGTLTVASGKFECGPRYSEYYSYNNHILSANSHKRTLIREQAFPVQFVKNTNSLAEGETPAAETVYAPIIVVYNTSFDGNIHHHGNMYFDYDYENDEDGALPVSGAAPYEKHTIRPDTYCYYTTNEDDSYMMMMGDADKASWYYSYYVNKSDFTYYSNVLSPSDNEDDFVAVTIYGYEDVILNAETHIDKETGNPVTSTDIDNDRNDFYAAIKMSGGTMDIRFGHFFNYFGVDTTACIDMMGGKLSIKKGAFSTRVPNSFEHVHHDVDAKEDDHLAFDRTEYFNNFYWYKYWNDHGTLDDLPGARAHKGAGFCILTSRNAEIDIGSGDFYSTNNNLIHMQNGTLNIGGGTFTKQNTIQLDTAHHRDTAIFMHDGLLNIGHAKYYIYGDYSRAIRMMDGELNVTGAECEIHGDYTFAVYSNIPEDNKLNLTDVKFTLNARTENGRLTGIYSAPAYEGAPVGTVNVFATEGEQSFIKINGRGSVGIYADGGKVYSEGCDYTVTGRSSAGVYINEGEVTFDSGTIQMDSDIGCYGIYAISKDPDKPVNVTLNHTTIDVGYVFADENTPPPHTVFDDNNGAGAAASVGVFLGSANENSLVTLNNTNIQSYEVGVAVSGGHVELTDTDDTPNHIKTDRASAIAVSGGNLTLGGNYNIMSFNTTDNDHLNSYELTVPYLYEENGIYDIRAQHYPNTDGVYVSGGQLEVTGNLNLTHRGLQNNIFDEDENDDNVPDFDYVFSSLTVTSYAVRVVGGNVTMYKGNITALAGGGICCTGGNLTMGRQDKQADDDITVHTDGEERTTLYNALGRDKPLGSWKSYKSITGGHAIELNGGNIIIHYGTYTADFGNGVAANSNGTIEIKDGNFYGWMGSAGNTFTVPDGAMNSSSRVRPTGPSAFYGLKVIGGAEVDIYGGTFDGGNGGAFVTGIDNYKANQAITGTPGAEAKVNVYAGTFGGDNTADAFNVYDHSIVVFGKYGAGHYQTAQAHQNAIVMNGKSASIAANRLTQNANMYAKCFIYIYYGNYKANVFNDGCCDYIYAYNTNTNFRYTIASGSITTVSQTEAWYDPRRN